MHHDPIHAMGATQPMRDTSSGGMPVVPTVLVVEDEHKLRDLLRATLERGGFAVLSSGRGAEGLGLAQSARPDLIILDLRLPDISGEEFTAELRESSDVPILMLTAKTSEQDRIRGFEVGRTTI